MKVVFLLGTVSRHAQEAGECISNADVEACEHISEKAGVDCDIVICCQDKATWAKGSKVTLKELRAERERAKLEILSYEPEMIVCFGKGPAQMIFNRGVKVGDLRHRQHELEEWPCPVWVTSSLEEASMKPGLVKFMGFDLLHAAKGETDVRWREHTVTSWTDPPDPRLRLDAKIGSLDLETYPGVDPRHPDARIRMAVVSTDDGFAQVIQAGPCSELPEWLSQWVESGRTMWGGSNIQFDAYWLRIRSGIIMQNYVCTSHIQHLLDENSTQKDLKSLVLIWTDLGDYSREQREMVTERDGWEFIEDHEMYQYAAGDGYGGFEVFRRQLEEIEAQGLQSAFQLHKETYAQLSILMNNGSCLDLAENAALGERYVNHLAQLSGEIRAVLGPINLNSAKQLVEALTRKVPSITLTEYQWKKWDDEEEKFSTKKAVLMREAHKHPIIAKVLEYRRRETLRRFVTGIHKHVRKRGKLAFVETSIRGDVTVTHRMSSSKPNLQNLARDTEEESALQLNVKSQYISRFTGGTLSEADESQLELRIAAIASADDAMMDAFLRGTDVHTELAAMMRGISTKHVTEAIRQAGKTTNFHVLYGGAAFGLSLRLGCSKPEAEGMIAQFYATFHGFEAWQRAQEAFAKKHLYVESMFGRRRHFVQPRSWKAPEGKRILRQAVNAPIQGDASAVTNIGIKQAMDRIEKERLQSKLFMTVHDSALTDNYPGEREYIHDILRDEMEHPNTEQFGVKLTLPLQVDIKTGPTWGSMSKLVTA